MAQVRAQVCHQSICRSPWQRQRHAGQMQHCSTDFAAYTAAVSAGGSTTGPYNTMRASCQAAAAVLQPAAAGTSAEPQSAVAAQNAAGDINSATGNLPDLSVRTFQSETVC